MIVAAVAVTSVSVSGQQGNGMTCLFGIPLYQYQMRNIRLSIPSFYRGQAVRGNGRSITIRIARVPDERAMRNEQSAKATDGQH